MLKMKGKDCEYEANNVAYDEQYPQEMGVASSVKIMNFVIQCCHNGGTIVWVVIHVPIVT